MIHILFVPGTFGTTVQYVVRQFNKNLVNHRILYLQDELILSDGSMHSFVKTGHFITLKEIEDYFDNKIDQGIVISSPIYPMIDAHAESIIKLFNERRPTDKYIFIYVADIDQAEVTILAQYHKIANGILNMSIGSVCGDNQHDIVKWNSEYTHWNQMQSWEFREWFSIFYLDWTQEWIDAKKFIPETWVPITMGDILENTRATLLDIIDHVGEFNPDMINEFNSFVNTWKPKQQYLLDEHAVIKNIVKFTTENIPYTWKKMNVISEAMIQRRLRDAGYEINCYNLNEFPTSSSELYQLLKRI